MNGDFVPCGCTRWRFFALLPKFGLRLGIPASAYSIQKGAMQQAAP